MPARIKVGISAYNDRGHIPVLLQSIDWYTFLDEPYDVVVCDDGSAPEFKEETRAACEQFGATFIEHEKNLGIPATWNHLALSLDNVAEIIVILNNDLLMPPNWLRSVVHFLDANKDNPHVGSCFWNPVNQVPLDAMKAFLPLLGHTSFTTRDAQTNRQRDFLKTSPMSMRTGHGQGLGRVMCPCGCGFAFRREVFEKVGPFDERLTSFHEESDWGTRCASMGMASFGFAYPRPYHGVSQTFCMNPELQASARMTASRALYRSIWNVPPEIPDDKYFEYVHNIHMTKIPPVSLKYLQPDYDAEPETLVRFDGEKLTVPQLIEREGIF